MSLPGVGRYVNSLGTEPPQSPREQSLESGDLAEDAVQVREKQLEVTSKGDPLPAKRAPSACKVSLQLGAENEKAEKVAKV